jgi:hypothetical protein
MTRAFARRSECFGIFIGSFFGWRDARPYPWQPASTDRVLLNLDPNQGARPMT